ncbi:MAG: BatA domain-containing protein [Thermoguttaceae bacterium]
MPTFLYPWLAIAGAAAAAVPVIVHLLNRRRFNVVQWAAMDFLREAVTRSRRMMELRDLLLLLLRVLCLLAFGMALARPYWNRFSQAAVDPNQPVHAVLLIDNSLSMSYQKPDGILLDEAKAKTRELLEDLPSGSVISVLPTCGSASGVNYEAYARREDALEALAAIKPVDCSAKPDQVIDRALEACRRTMNTAGRRIILVTDQQVVNWSADAEWEHLKQLPCPMQVVQVTPDQIENVWVNDVQLREGVANVECPAVFIATIGYQGGEPRKGVPVVLKVDGRQVASQTIDLLPGQMREIVFPEYEFPKSSNPEQTRYATVEVSIAKENIPFDRLPDDNCRAIVVPVADSIPVVFVDSVGAHEDAKKKIYGDTYWLRRWLAPQSGQPGQDRPLVQIRHVAINQLSRKVLADARLVVIGGVPRPSPEEVELLDEYVEQGGNLLLAAGGNFDPAAWTEVAWKNGLGILPAPLAPTAQGYVREDRRWATSKTAPLTLDFANAQHHYFRPEGVSDDYLREALGPPTFFHKVVAAKCDKTVQDGVAEAAAKYFGSQREKLADIDRQLTALGTAASAGGSQKKIADLDQERDKLQPSWLTWKKADEKGQAERLPVDDLAQRARPAILARYNNGLPMLLRRQWGRGQVLFLTTSLSPEWTTLHDLPQSAWLMDHIARCMLSETLTSWNNVNSEKGLVLPVAVGERGAQFTLIDPDGKQRALSVDALGGDRYGIGLNDLTRRGIYRVKAARSDGAAQSDGAILWEIPLAVNGPAEESQLNPVRQSLAGITSFVDASAQAYSASPLQLEGVDLWKWLVGLMLAGLLAELLLAGRSTSRGKAAS